MFHLTVFVVVMVVSLSVLFYWVVFEPDLSEIRGEKINLQDL